MRQLIILILIISAITVNSNSIKSILQNRSIDSVRKIFQCAVSFDYACVLDNVEDGADKVYNNLLREADADVHRSLNGVARKKEEEELPSSIISTITNLLSELPELLRSSLSAALSNEEGDEKTNDEEDENEKDNNNDEGEEEEEEDDEGADEEDESDAEEDEDTTEKAESKSVSINKNCKSNTTCVKVETKSTALKRGKNVEVSRKKKKGKIQKLKALIKLAIVGIVLVVKLSVLLKLLAAKLQIKFFLIALVNLGINVARFWWDLKKGHQPQKVIYYEHAQHQHHYDGAEDWHSSGPGPGDSYWGRAYEKGEDKNAQDLAYSKQAPGGTTYSRVNDKPNFSWNPWAERSL